MALVGEHVKCSVDINLIREFDNYKVIYNGTPLPRYYTFLMLLPTEVEFEITKVTNSRIFADTLQFKMIDITEIKNSLYSTGNLEQELDLHVKLNNVRNVI